MHPNVDGSSGDTEAACPSSPVPHLERDGLGAGVRWAMSVGRSWQLKSLDQFGSRGCANVGTFTLLADEAEELDRAGFGGPEPMWGAGVELGDFSWFEDEVVFAEDQ